MRWIFWISTTWTFGIRINTISGLKKALCCAVRWKWSSPVTYKITTPWRRMDCAGTAPCIPNSGIRWIWVVTSMFRPLYALGYSLPNPDQDDAEWVPEPVCALQGREKSLPLPETQRRPPTYSHYTTRANLDYGDILFRIVTTNHMYYKSIKSQIRVRFTAHTTHSITMLCNLPWREKQATLSPPPCAGRFLFRQILEVWNLAKILGNLKVCS